jgi:hypothetical protein
MSVRRLAACAVAALVLSPVFASAQCVSLTTLGAPSAQDFNTLSNVAGSTTNNLTITGWFLTESGGGARDNEQYAVDTGGSGTGDMYSYGAAGSTERALGELRSGTLIPTFGACFTNNTGATIASLDVAYTGEQWRLGTPGRTDRMDFQFSTDATSVVTGTWTDVNALDFTAPSTVAPTGARDGNAAANRTALSATIPSLSIANGATVWVRWTDLDATGADDGLSADDFSITPQGGGPTPTLNINDVTLAEGDPPGTTTFTFDVTLSSLAGLSGVTFDIATADGTAQDGNPVGEDNDYVAQSLTGQTIAAGSSGPYSFSVTVNRDSTAEPNETFFVNVTNITGANAGDTQGQGTINNDDVTITPIHDIQGPGSSSPLVATSVTTTGVVTGRKSNGFFIQEPDASVDANPLTSEGIFVFTGGAPPAAAAIGNLVQVGGTVVEFAPAADPLQPPLTEIGGGPTVVQLSTGNPLPAPIPLTPTFPDPAGPFDQLERIEGMRVSVASLTVGGATQGIVNEPNATAGSNGVFHGVVTGNARAFREPGIEAPDPAPSGTVPPIPRWDSNPELVTIDSDAQGGPQLDVSVGAVVTGLIGPLDYSFRRYTVLPDGPPAAPPVAAGGVTPTPVTAPTTREFAVASYNLERFYDTFNDPGTQDAVLTAAAFDNRLNKASNGIRNFLRAPDILGVVEMENLTTLQALAARISSDAIAAGQPDPLYQAFLVEGNDVGGIDVGFLVKQQIVAGSTPRVTVNAVVQENAGELFVNPDASTELLNDRPSLRLDAVVNNAFGATFPVTVIVNHLRSLNGVNDIGAGSNGWATVGDRVRAKRQRQAESLANLVQARQTANPAERIILVGDFNAFEFNDGFVDSVDVIRGTPVPDNETAVPGDGVDLVNPDFSILLDAPAQRYSFVFGGNAQSLDHALVNQPLIAATTAQRIEHARINADFRSIERNNPATPTRLSDHDPLVTYFQVAGFAAADLSVTKTDTPDPVNAGTNLTYTITVANAGPDAASAAAWSDTLPAGTTFVSLSPVAGWTCTTPAVGGTGTVDCNNPSFAVGSAVFTLVVNVDASVLPGTLLGNTAAATSTTTDPNAANNASTTTTTVGSGSADLSVTLADAPDPVTVGQNLTYTIDVANVGPSNAVNASVSLPLPAGTTFISNTVPGGWSCTTPTAGTNGTVSCSNASFGVTTAPFTVVVQVGNGVAGGTVLGATATVSSATPDPVGANNSATTTTTVLAPAAISATKTVSGPRVPGQSITYTIVISNAGPGAQSDNPGNEFTDVLPSPLTLQGASASSGTAVATAGTNTVTWNGSIAAGGSVTITIVAFVNATVAPGTTITNQGTVSFDADGNGTNEATTVTDDPSTGPAGDPTGFIVLAILAVPILSPITLVLLLGSIGMLGALTMRRRAAR